MEMLPETHTSATIMLLNNGFQNIFFVCKFVSVRSDFFLLVRYVIVYNLSCAYSLVTEQKPNLKPSRMPSNRDLVHSLQPRAFYVKFPLLLFVKCFGCGSGAAIKRAKKYSYRNKTHDRSQNQQRVAAPKMLVFDCLQSVRMINHSRETLYFAT